MNISILGDNSQTITVGCKCAYFVSAENSIALTFDNDGEARTSEEMLKKMNLKTKHNNCEITVLNISDYNLQFN
mgnify:CR=1 FL=1